MQGCVFTQSEFLDGLSFGIESPSLYMIAGVGTLASPVRPQRSGIVGIATTGDASVPTPARRPPPPLRFTSDAIHRVPTIYLTYI
jgi:hypothetical protein